MRAVYLGNWIANAHREEDLVSEYQEMEDYVFSQAAQFGLDVYADHNADEGQKFFPSEYFERETDVHLLQEEYDQETFWDELAEQLGEKVFFETHTKAQIEKMTIEKRFEVLNLCIDAAREEFAKSGIKRLTIVKK